MEITQIALLLILLLFGCRGTAVPSSTAVPPANPPTIDGVLSPDEWDTAVVENLTDGSEPC